MTSTSHADFSVHTEALEVAAAFPNSVRDKTILVTGVNRGGIGYTTAEALASQAPARIIVTGRSSSKLQESINALKETYPNVEYRPLIMDLSRQKDVRNAADQLLSWSDVPTIDIVVNGAGVMGLPERTLSVDGIEMHFATNHIGHYLFTNLIMSKILKASETAPKGATRIVNVSALSPSWTGIRWSDINFDKVSKTLPKEEQPPYDVLKDWGTTDPENKAYVPIEGYSQSKVANLLFSIGLTHRLYERHGVLSLAVHPGVISTELGRNIPGEASVAVRDLLERKKDVFESKSQGAGAATSVTAALDPKLTMFQSKNGKANWGSFLADCQICDKTIPRAESSEEAQKLWTLSEQLVKQQFKWE